MKKRVALIIAVLMIINLFGGSMVWAKDYKHKDFLPPGLAKKFAKWQMMPPPFQNIDWEEYLEELEEEMEERYKEDDEEEYRERYQEQYFEEFYKYLKEYFKEQQLLNKGVIEGEVVFKAKVGKEWIVIKGEDELKSLQLRENELLVNIGDIVEVKYYLNKALELKILDKDDVITDGELAYSFYINPSTLELGDQVALKLKVKNNTDSNITKQFTSGQRYDFIVKNDGKKVWQWSENFDFITVIQNITFEPGDVETYSVSWKPKETGRYTVEAYFMGESKVTPVAKKELVVLKDKNEIGNLNYQLEVIKGDPNLLILKVTNTSDDPLYVTLPTGQQYDFLLTRKGTKVWQWSDGRVFTQAQQRIKFEAGETKVYYAQYTPDKTGEYKVYGFFKGEESKAIGPKIINID